MSCLLENQDFEKHLPHLELLDPEISLGDQKDQAVDQQVIRY